MPNKLPNKKPFITRKYFMLLIVCIVTGFIIGFSYNLSKEKRTLSQASSNYEQENRYRTDLIEQQERNKELAEEQKMLEEKIRDYENEISQDEKSYEQLIEQANSLRLQLGLTEGFGEGVKVTLQDGDYDPSSTNPNDYIVHESHIFSVLNELKIAGAEAILINGQRLRANSYVSCNGPVITIDGQQYPAPFVIEAVGKQDTLMTSLELTGGVLDQLLNDRINVTLEKLDRIEASTIHNEG